MSTPDLHPEAAKRRIGVALLRVLGATAIALALYYLLPIGTWPFGLNLSILIVGLIGLMIYAGLHIWAIINSRNPSVRAVEGFFIFVVLFLVLIAAWYYVVAHHYSHSFTQPNMTRTDTLYFAITVFSTVGFGDISAASQFTRVLVMIQMVLDLFILGLGIRILTRAVQLGTARHATPTTEPTES